MKVKKYIKPKSQVFLNKLDLKNKIDNVEGFSLTDYDKEYLLNLI